MSAQTVPCGSCGATLLPTAVSCSFCGAAQAASSVPQTRSLEPGAVIRALDLTKVPLPGTFKPGRLQTLPEGARLNVPAGASYMDMGEGWSDLRDACVSVVGRCEDEHGALGVIARQQKREDTRRGYGLLVHAAQRSFKLFYFVVAPGDLQFNVLRQGERPSTIRGVGESNRVELRVAGTALQGFVNGVHVATTVDDRSVTGTPGWLVRSLGGIARLLLERVEVRQVTV